MGLRWKVALGNFLLVGFIFFLTHLYIAWNEISERRLLADPTLLAMVAVITIVATSVSVNALVKALRKNRSSIHKMASGDFEEQMDVPVNASGELENLAHALEEMRRKTRDRIERITTDRSRFEIIINSITEGIMVTGSDGRVVMANAALAKLVDADGSLEGRRPVELVRNNAVEDAIAKSLESGEEIRLETALTGRQEQCLDVHISPFKQGEESLGVVVVFYDISRLRQLERTRRDFVANVSHELRTPLTAIMGCAETIAAGALEDRQVTSRFVRMITEHADRLAGLLDDLLDLSRLESEGFELSLEDCQLCRLVEGCARTVSQQAAAKKISIKLDVPEQTYVRCDSRQIEQSLSNLLDNAIKYSTDGGYVWVNTRTPENASDAGKIALEVADSGIGISSEHLKRVFERFYRVDKSRSRAEGGTGLGLSIVRHIVEAHGERVYVESELGKGSTFGFTLSLSQN